MISSLYCCMSMQGLLSPIAVLLFPSASSQQTPVEVLLVCNEKALFDFRRIFMDDEVFHIVFLILIVNIILTFRVQIFPLTQGFPFGLGVVIINER